MTITLIPGDALTSLQTLESESIDCCITSPPYWSLRDYKVDGQLGLEPTFSEYINKLITIFDEVKRVLKKTGTCWVVIGDTYSSKPVGHFTGGGKEFAGRDMSGVVTSGKMDKTKVGIPEKSLCMIPERFATKMIDNDWILRNKIIWYKPNSMPSSAKDRFTVDWEYVYFFTKSQRYFFETQYDPYVTPMNRWGGPIHEGKDYYKTENAMGSRERPNRPNKEGRIKRCVWRINTRPYSGAHFAVFPPDLVLSMIKAGCPQPGTVLDPFMGSGTVGLVAAQNARDFVGIELNAEYVKLAKQRLEPWFKQERLTCASFR